MMNNHPHIATPYEIEALAQRRLKAIVLPLLPEPTKHSATWSWSGSPRSHIDWLHDSSCDDIRLFMALKYQVSDRIYLQEEWCINDMHDMYFVESTTPEAEHIGWEPASTMPMEAAQHWFTIAGVRVVQIKDLPYGTIYMPKSGCLSLVHEYRILCDSWNAAYPEQPWQGDRHVIVLQVEAIVQ